MSDAATRPLGVVAHYNLLERLDPAGPGDLYRARDTRLGRTVAVRLLPRGYTDPEPLHTFVERTRGLSTLSHPNVIALFDVGEQDGQGFLVFEFVKGQSLRTEMAGRSINVKRAVDFGIQIADALADAHAYGYLHSGLSLESIVVSAKGHAKIPALELATREGFAADLHGGLRDCQSPEEERNQRQDERSDVYSTGAVLYEMLAARAPLHRGSAAPSAANAQVPRDLDEVVLKAVSPNPDNRQQSAAVLAMDLRRVAAGLEARDRSPVDQREEVPTGSWGSVAAMTITILLVIAALVWWFR